MPRVMVYCNEIYWFCLNLVRRLPAVSYLTGSWSKGKSETTAISLGEHIEVLLMGNECYNKFQINNYLPENNTF